MNESSKDDVKTRPRQGSDVLGDIPKSSTAFYACIFVMAILSFVPILALSDADNIFVIYSQAQGMAKGDRAKFFEAMDALRECNKKYVTHVNKHSEMELSNQNMDVLKENSMKMVRRLLEAETTQQVVNQQEESDHEKLQQVRSEMTSKMKKLNATYAHVFLETKQKLKKLQQDLHIQVEMNENLENQLNTLKNEKQHAPVISVKPTAKPTTAAPIGQIIPVNDNSISKDCDQRVEEVQLEMQDEIDRLNSEVANLKQRIAQQSTQILQTNVPQQQINTISEEIGCSGKPFEFNSIRPGNTLFEQITKSARKCKQLCTTDPSCKAWTFKKTAGVCSLTGTILERTKSSCCVSGVVCR